MTGRTDSRLRHRFLLAMLGLAGLAIVLRTGYWQVIEHDRLAGLARTQTELSVSQASRRGAIYDRTGAVLLATTLDRSRLVASPRQLKPADRTRYAEALVEILGATGAAAERIGRRMAGDAGYVVLADGIEESRAAGIRQALVDRGLIGVVSLETHPVRSYPLQGGGNGTSLAANLLGFVNAEGQGQYGVEQAYHEQLAGTPRVILAQRDAAGRAVWGTEQVLDPGVRGSDLTLTVDAALQSALEQELFAAWVADRAKQVSAVVIDPYTGEVYAEATYPSYDANTYQKTAQTHPERFTDPVIGQFYEPGSVFKLLTAAAALRTGVVTTTTRVKDARVLVVDGGRITNADRKGKGWIQFQDGIAYSRNVVAAKVAMELGPTTKAAAAELYRTWTRFGFGRPTGIDLAGEVSGMLKDPSIHPWREIDLANGAFGQSVAVTPIQLATAYAAMVNGGTLVRPHVVKAVGGNEVVQEPGDQVLDGATSDQLVGLMRHVVSTVPVYASRTLVRGYQVGGKTGTAQIWDPKANGGAGDWKRNIFNFSFVGFIGKEAPRLVVAVRITEGKPTINRPGEIVLPVMSFELFRRIATDAMTMLDIPAVPPRQPLTASR